MEYEIFHLTGRKKNVLKFILRAISLIEIEQQIIQWQLQSGIVTKKETFQRTDLKWTGTVADFIELMNGTIETKRLNNGDIALNDAVNQLCGLLSFEVKDCYDTFRAIRRRVGSRTLFLDEMIEKLNERMDNMDNGIFRKKKIR